MEKVRYLLDTEIGSVVWCYINQIILIITYEILENPRVETPRSENKKGK